MIFFGIISIVLNIIYYLLFAQSYILEYVINLFIVIVLGCFLFYSHSYAGGDTKMTIVIAMLYPARYYLSYKGSCLTLFLAIALAILAGYFYLLLNSFWNILNHSTVISKEYILNQIIIFVKRYLCALLYLSIINELLFFINSKGIFINIWLIRLICLTLTFVISKYQIFRKPYIIIFIGLLVTFISFIEKVIPFSLDFNNYILVLFLMFCQLFIRTNIYETVRVADLKKGMILTSESSFPMQFSITPGLPRMSDESLKSRLTESEIISIKMWANATGVTDLTIIKKVPFAVFISIGFVLYFIIWSTL